MSIKKIKTPVYRKDEVLTRLFRNQAMACYFDIRVINDIVLLLPHGLKYNPMLEVRILGNYTFSIVSISSEAITHKSINDVIDINFLSKFVVNNAKEAKKIHDYYNNEGNKRVEPNSPFKVKCKSCDGDGKWLVGDKSQGFYTFICQVCRGAGYVKNN